MAEHVWSVLCRKVLIDKDTNATSLMELLEVVVLHIVDDEEFQHLAGIKKKAGFFGGAYAAEFLLLSWWERSDLGEKESATARISLETPTGAIIRYDQEMLIDLEESVARRIKVGIDRLYVADAGRHWFIVEKKAKTKGGRERWERVARVPLYVEVIPVVSAPMPSAST